MHVYIYTILYEKINSERLKDKQEQCIETNINLIVSLLIYLVLKQSDLEIGS